MRPALYFLANPVFGEQGDHWYKINALKSVTLQDVISLTTSARSVGMQLDFNSVVINIANPRTLLLVAISSGVFSYNISHSSFVSNGKTRGMCCLYENQVLQYISSINAYGVIMWR